MVQQGDLPKQTTQPQGRCLERHARFAQGRVGCQPASPADHDLGERATGARNSASKGSLIFVTYSCTFARYIIVEVLLLEVCKSNECMIFTRSSWTI
mmetsp:Transcript_14143/g.39104  ORF Transcript_14143/g.39104 Transcript_14143/m.39104 type:complete len:97 (+) Transcript_14143:1119-1409(+)